MLITTLGVIEGRLTRRAQCGVGSANYSAGQDLEEAASEKEEGEAEDGVACSKVGNCALSCSC